MSMALAQPTPTPGSVFVGYPEITDALDEYFDSFGDIYMMAIQQVMAYAQSDMRRAARSLEGWSDLEQNLAVDFDGFDFVYIVVGDDDVKSRANALEYGDGETPPTGFLRKTANRQAPRLSLMLDQLLGDTVPSA